MLINSLFVRESKATEAEAKTLATKFTVIESPADHK